MHVYFLSTNFLLCSCLVVVPPSSPTLNPRLVQLAMEVKVARLFTTIVEVRQHYPTLSMTVANAL